jgi:hypothetical protein
MHEPTRVSPRKLASARAEGVAAILTATGLLLAIERTATGSLHTDHVGARPANREKSRLQA